MSGVTLIPDIVWVKRGVAKQMPHKVKLDPEELRNFIHSEDIVTEESYQAETAMEEEIQEQQNNDLRGSVVEASAEVGELKEPDSKKTVKMSGIAMYASPLDDPYITMHVDSDAEEDKEDFEIKNDDNLVAVAKIDKDDYTLEIYVYNENNDDWYVHHDYMLDAPPLCLEHLLYDPGEQSRKGNLLAVGTMKPIINIWDLDIVNAVEPVVTFGKSAGNRRKRDGSAQGHSDAVLSLSWNRNSEHVIASGSADQTVVLWDLDDIKVATVFPDCGGKVQAVEWHPGEISVLLSGTLSGDVALRDCRQSTSSPSRQWKVHGEVEQLLWDHFNPFCFYAATDTGKLYYFDSRTLEPKYVVTSHDGGIHGLSQSFKVKGLVCTCGTDSMLKVWKNSESGMQTVYSEKMDLGELHSVKFSPDSGSVVAVGGSKESLVKIVAVDTFEAVRNVFSG